jgi:hypothetical protein
MGSAAGRGRKWRLGLFANRWCREGRVLSWGFRQLLGIFCRGLVCCVRCGVCYFQLINSELRIGKAGRRGERYICRNILEWWWWGNCAAREVLAAGGQKSSEGRKYSVSQSIDKKDFKAPGIDALGHRYFSVDFPHMQKCKPPDPCKLICGVPRYISHFSLSLVPNPFHRAQSHPPRTQLSFSQTISQHFHKPHINIHRCRYW